MPIVPFIGLSILIHIFIIFLYKIFSRKNQEYKHKVSLKVHKRWTSWLIILTVFVFIFVNAVFLVRASVIDRHSYVHKFFDYSSQQPTIHLSSHNYQDNFLKK